MWIILVADSYSFQLCIRESLFKMDSNKHVSTSKMEDLLSCLGQNVVDW